MSMPHRAKSMQEAAKVLKIAWHRAGEHWKDTQHDRFGTECVDPLERAVRHAASTLDEVQVMLNKADRDCR